MTDRDCTDEMADALAEREERRRHDELMDHPDCRDPEHPGCSRCRECEPTLEDAYAEGRADQTDEFAALLPGPYYIDPPDGGSVTVLEQFQRMAEDARKWREQQERTNLAIDCEMRCEG